MHYELKRAGFFPLTVDEKTAIVVATSLDDIVVEVWYNRRTRDWVAMPIEKSTGYQAGDSEYVGTVECAILSARFMAKNVTNRDARVLYIARVDSAKKESVR